MGTFVEAGKTGEFKDGMMKEVEVQDKKILWPRLRINTMLLTADALILGGICHGAF